MKRSLLTLFLSLACTFAGARSYDARYAETYIQYVPAVTDLCLGFCGVQPKHNAAGRAIELGIAYGCEIVAVNLILKNCVREERPDGRSFNSFPSGHTAMAFVGAELVRKEYGWTWGAGAYAVAASVGVLRVCHQRHWWWDACAGAGIGILCANAGCLLLEPVERLLGINETSIAFAPTVDPVSGALCAQICYRF